MKEFFKFLNDNAGVLNIIFSGLVSLATIVYAILTWKLIIETRRMRKAQTDAKIAVGFDFCENSIHFIDLVVKNEGLGPAYDISFEIDECNNCTDDIKKSIEKLGFITHGIKYLSQGAKVKTFFTSMLENFDGKINSSILISVEYKTSFGEKVRDKFFLSFAQFKGLTKLGTPPLFEIADGIKEIRLDIHNLATGWSKMNIINYSLDDIEEENEKIRERFRDYIKKDEE